MKYKQLKQCFAGGGISENSGTGRNWESEFKKLLDQGASYEQAMDYIASKQAIDKGGESANTKVLGSMGYPMAVAAGLGPEAAVGTLGYHALVPDDLNSGPSESPDERMRRSIEEPGSSDMARLREYMKRKKLGKSYRGSHPGMVGSYQDGGIVRDTSLYQGKPSSGFVTDQEPEVEEKKSKYRLTGTTKLDFKERKISKFDKLMDLLKDG